MLIAWYAIAIYGTFSIHFHLLAITTYLYQNTRSRTYFLMVNVFCAYFLRQNKYSMCVTLRSVFGELYDSHNDRVKKLTVKHFCEMGEYNNSNLK